MLGAEMNRGGFCVFMYENIVLVFCFGFLGLIKALFYIVEGKRHHERSNRKIRFKSH